MEKSTDGNADRQTALAHGRIGEEDSGDDTGIVNDRARGVDQKAVVHLRQA